MVLDGNLRMVISEPGVLGGAPGCAESRPADRVRIFGWDELPAESQRRGASRPSVGAMTPRPNLPHAEGRPEPSESPTFPIVGIGASAGGLEAFRQLLERLPADTGMAFVLVQHLDPDAREPAARDPARAGDRDAGARGRRDGMRVEPDHVYVIPPEHRHDASRTGACSSRRAPTRGRAHCRSTTSCARSPRSRASRAIGVVLSGTGIGRHARAARRSRRRAASRSRRTSDPPSTTACRAARSPPACVDFVLPPARSPRELARHRPRTPTSRPPPPSRHRQDAGRRARRSARSSRVLRDATGVDFAHYKPTTRPAAHRAADGRCSGIDDARGRTLELPASRRPTRSQALYRRPPDQRHQLLPRPGGVRGARARRCFPSSLKRRGADEPVRDLGAGLLDRRGGLLARDRAAGVPRGDAAGTRRVQIFAHRPQRRGDRRRRAPGVYPASIAARRLAGAAARASSSRCDGRLPDQQGDPRPVRLRAQDLTRDPPFSRLDLVSCRNVLIYLEPALQKRVMPIFHYALQARRASCCSAPRRRIGAFARPVRGRRQASTRSTRRSRRRRPACGFALGRRDRDGAPPAARRAAAREPARRAADARSSEADRLLLGRYAPAGVW